LELKTDELNWFYKYVNEIDNQDNETFASVSEETRKKTYREALKEMNPGDHTITCPICNSSPWKYKEGDCQLCGNTIT
jgi:mobilome CxxCx(11)CxxC protein